MKTRHPLRLNGYDYSQSGFYFVTICVQNRHECLSKIKDNIVLLNDWGRIVEEVWCRLPEHYRHCVIHQCVVMPNHFHGILQIFNAGAGLKPAPTHGLSEIVRAFKTFSSRQINAVENHCVFHWQRGFHDHIIRNEKDLARMRQYILDNPKSWAMDSENILMH